jgi:hypothetical protein
MVDELVKPSSQVCAGYVCFKVQSADMFSKPSRALDLVCAVVHGYECSKLQDRLPLDAALKVSYEPLVKTKVKSSGLDYSGQSCCSMLMLDGRFIVATVEERCQAWANA